MSDYLPKGDQKTISLIDSLPLEGNPLDAIPTATMSVLKQAKNARMVELGQYFEKNGGFGHGTEYLARLLRVREVLDLEATTIDSFRDKLLWEPDDRTADLHEILGLTRNGEELRITDYKGRRYSFVKADKTDLISILYAQDENNNPIQLGGTPLAGSIVTLDSLETPADRQLASLGMQKNGAEISLVKPGVKIRSTRNGEEYDSETRGKHKMPVTATARRMGLVLVLKDNVHSKKTLGVLVSTIKLIPSEQKEQQALEAAQWRIRDSAQTIQTLLGKQQDPKPINIGNMSVHSFEFADGEIDFVAEDERARTEYSFSPSESAKKPMIL